MKKILNYTDRKDLITIVGENPEIKMHIIEEDGETFFEPEVRLGRIDQEGYAKQQQKFDQAGKKVACGVASYQNRLSDDRFQD